MCMQAGTYLSVSCSSSCSCSRAQGPKSKWTPEPGVDPSWGSAGCAPSPSLAWAEEGVEPAHIVKRESGVRSQESGAGLCVQMDEGKKAA